MTNSKRRLGVALAIASVTAGFSVAALAARYEYDPPSRALHYALERSARVTTLLEPLTLDNLPKPAAHGDVAIGPISYRLLHPHAARAACASGWRDLASGPEGRRVYVRCPGDTGPMPTPRPVAVSSLERLPVPRSVPQASADLAARPGLATEAARAVEQDLQRRMNALSPR